MFEYVFCWTNDKQEGRQNGHRLSVFSCGHSNLYHPISYKFHIWITVIKLWPKFEYRCCPMNDNQDGCQNGRHLWSVCTCGHINLVIFQMSYMDYFDQTLSNMGSVRRTINKMVEKIATACLFSLVDTLTESFSITGFPSNFIYDLLVSNSGPSSNKRFVRWTIHFNQDGSQNCRRTWSVCTSGHSYLVIYLPVAFKLHIWITLIKCN